MSHTDSAPDSHSSAGAASADHGHSSNGHGPLPPGHYHHWEPEQAYHGSKLAMWIFLATEVHLFGGLFSTFAYYRWAYLDTFNEFASHLNWKLGALNTAVLLTSSYTMVRAVDAAQKGLNKRVRIWIDITLFCACIFLVVKYIEYTDKFSHGIYPSTHIFYGLYFTMTGLHGVHVLGGMGVMLWLRALAKKDRFSPAYYTPVEVSGLYWHLVDIIWIYLFPVVYLLGGIHL
jgi:cytochrome c oxidase subunit III